jgi:hypothetical protein
MPRKTITCKRVYRDGHGALQRCNGPTFFALVPGTWTCTWCGHVMPGIYPGLGQ